MVVIRNEYQFQSRFTRLLKEGWLPTAEYDSVVFELKVVRGRPGRFRMAQLASHQNESLRRAAGMSKRPCVHKISDMSAGMKPFDCFSLSGGVGAYVAVWWVGPGEGYCFPIGGICDMTLADARLKGIRIPLGDAGRKKP